MEILAKKLDKLGLSERKKEVYLYALKNKYIKLKNLSSYLEISVPGTSKILKEMIEDGFITYFELGGHKVFMPTDIKELRKKLLKNLEEKKTDTEKLFQVLESRYGEHGVKILRTDVTALKDSYKGEFARKVQETKKIFEVFDLRTLFKPVKKPLEYKNVDCITVYNGEENQMPWGERIFFDELDKTYANILSTEDVVKFTTSKKEILYVKNEDIARTMQFVIKKLRDLLAEKRENKIKDSK